MQIRHFDIFVCEIPFRFSLKHALAEHNRVLSLFVKVTCADGTVGFGETVPRHYVTQETIASEYSGIQQAAVLFVGQELVSPSALVLALQGILPFGAGQTALELALLDAGSKSFGLEIPQLLGRPVVRDTLTYSGVVMNGSLRRAWRFARLMKQWGFPEVKVKLGLGHERLVMRLARAVLGPDVQLRVDANGIWEPAEAIEQIAWLQQKYQIESIEQPTGLTRQPDHQQRLKQVTDAVTVPVVADESLSTVESALELAQSHSCDRFHIRVSKHGGLLNALKIADIAADYGIECQLGAQVGESEVLAAAGQQFARLVPNLVHAEGGGGGKWLFPKPFVKEDLGPGPRGETRLVTGLGLGVTVDEATLAEYTLQKDRVDMATVREYQKVCRLLPELYEK
jgi:muconate cycloisomerase